MAASEDIPLHDLPRRTYYGYLDWDLNRWLALLVPVALGISLMLVVPGGKLWLFIGMLSGALMVFTPPVRGEYPYEWLVSQVRSFQILRRNDGAIPVERTKGKAADAGWQMDSVQLHTLQIISDDGRSGELLSVLTSPGKRNTVFLVLEPNSSAAYMDPRDRYYYDDRLRHMVKALAHIVDEVSLMTIQLPFDFTPVKEHYENGRLYLGEEVRDLGSVDPLQQKAIDHLQAVQQEIVGRQPRVLQVIAIRLSNEKAWMGSRPARLAKNEWDKCPLHDVLQVASTAARKLNVKVRIPHAEELFVIMQASMDPTVAQDVYQRWYDEVHSDVSVLDTVTYQRGPFPYRVVADQDGIRCGGSTSAFLEVTDFRGSAKVYPGSHDPALLFWDPQGFITHIVDYRIGQARAEEYKLQFATDVLQQRDQSSSLFRPKRAKRTRDTEEAYETVARSGMVIQASWHIRVTCRSAATRDWLTRQVQMKIDEAGFNSRIVKGASRQVKCLLRSIGGGPQ